MNVARELVAVAREMLAMDVTIGEAGLEKSWQAAFPPMTECCRCHGPARIAFVAHECMDEKCDGSQITVSQLHPNEGAECGPYWVHDAMAVAVYLCEDCLEPTALYNQA
jgi:hypothetical protein